MSKSGEWTGVDRRWLWALSVMFGASLMLHASDLKSGNPRAGVIVRSHAAVASPSAPAAVATCSIPVEATAPAVMALSRDIARRFHVAESAAVGITRAAFTAGRVRGIDPVLVLAVAAVESKFKSRAVNPVTGAQGLMQIMSKWHQDKILKVGGDPSLLLIEPNINVGAAILADYLEAEGGNLEGALSRYLGTVGGVHYAEKVHFEMKRLTRIAERI